MIPVYSSEEEERIKLNEKPRAKKASRRYVANPESNQLKLDCLAIRVALLCEYIRNKIRIAGFKQRLSGAFALYGWGYTLRNPIRNLKTTMDDDVDFKYTKTSTLRRARALFKRLQRNRCNPLGFGGVATGNLHRRKLQPTAAAVPCDLH